MTLAISLNGFISVSFVFVVLADVVGGGNISVEHTDADNMSVEFKILRRNFDSLSKNLLNRFNLPISLALVKYGEVDDFISVKDLLK